MKFALAFLLLVSPAHAGEFVSLISAAAAATASPAPLPPAPAPAPSGECDNCNGTGKLGDGTVFVPCPVCGGDGVKGQPGGTAESVSKAAPPVVKPLVVVKQPGPMWNQNGHSATVDHLVNEHGIDRATASRMTREQRDIAHSNAHNSARNVSSNCPNGNCPRTTYGRGLFGRRR